MSENAVQLTMIAQAAHRVRRPDPGTRYQVGYPPDLTHVTHSTNSHSQSLAPNLLVLTALLFIVALYRAWWR